VSAGLEARELAARPGEAGGACGIGEGHHAVGVADIEGIAQQRHAERLSLPFEKGVAHFGHAIAVGIAQQRDPVRADAGGGRALHRADHRVVEDRTGWRGH
jgi:hypothetical protein